MENARLGAFIAVVILSAACGGGQTGGKDAKVATAPRVGVAGSCAWTPGTEPIGRSGASATLALAKVLGRRVAFIADEDAKAILTVDLDTRAELAQTPLGATPAQLYVARDGRIFATLRDTNQIVVLGATRADAPLSRLCGATTPAEPIAIAATPDDAQIVVTAGWGQKITVFDAKTLANKLEVKVAREPRSVVVSDDGKTAFVSHAVGSVVSAVDLASAKHDEKLVSMRGWMPGEAKMIEQRKKMLGRMQGSKGAAFAAEIDADAKKMEDGRQSCQGFALAKSAAIGGRIFAPQVMVEPGDPDARPDGYGDQNGSTEAPAVAVVDEGTSTTLSSSVTIANDGFASSRGNDTRDEKPECLLPRAAVVDPATKSLLVTCYGIDAVVAYDGTAATPLAAERRRWVVGSGPSGVAIDTEKHRAVVWAQFDRSISSFDIGGTELVEQKPHEVQKDRLVALSTKMPAEYALGRILFHAAGDNRISHDGRACASCHPDGRDDAITWATPEGPRRSIMLAGRIGKTAPYSWNGAESTLHNHLGNTFDRLSGKGLRSIELDALVAYISAMPAPAPLSGEAVDKAKVERGKAIFASKETGCATCHAGSDYTDGKNHDVGSKVKADVTGAFNTPSLHLVGSTGPYFHDGRYTSLSELLVKSDGKMGHTKHLTNGDVEALESFLRTL